VNNAKTCSKCYWVDIIGGRYYYCPDKTSERKAVECSSNYAKNVTYNCLQCPTGCTSCSYNSQTKTFHCPSCYSSYFILNGICNRCPAHCTSCNLNQNNLPVCTGCSGGYYILGNNCESCGLHCSVCSGNKCSQCNSGYCLDNGECIKCIDNCKICRKESNGSTKCTNCYSSYALDSANNKCIHCPDNCGSCNYQNNDLICISCYYNNIMLRNKCKSCSSDDSIGGSSCSTCSYSKGTNKCYSCTSNDYSYISNQYKCLPNTNPKEEIFGCIIASLNNGKYDCSACKSGFILIINDKKCKKPEDMNLNYCSSAYNKNNTDYPIYSCNSCINSNYAKLYKNIDNIEIMNCVVREGKLKRCLVAK